jgi:hypothetical protein
MGYERKIPAVLLKRLPHIKGRPILNRFDDST